VSCIALINNKYTLDVQVGVVRMQVYLCKEKTEGYVWLILGGWFSLDCVNISSWIYS